MAKLGEVIANGGAALGGKVTGLEAGKSLTAAVDFLAPKLATVGKGVLKAAGPAGYVLNVAQGFGD